MSEMKITKLAAVYIRVSTEDQVEVSPESQLATIRSWAGKNGYLIPDQFIYQDKGISGRSAAKRPQFQELVARAKSQEHPFDAILVWKFSRFARSQEESIVYKAMLQRVGVDVISVSEPLIDGPFGSLIERIIEWMDEYYSIRLAGEVKRSMTLNAEKGVRQTAPPFGYRKNETADGPFMVPDEAEAPLIREVFRRYLAGEPTWQIVDALNSRGVRTHRGSLIENRTISYWLQNPVYIGLNRWTPTGRTRRNFANPDTLLVPGDHEPLISREDFDAAQQLIARASERHRPKSRPSFELKDWMGGVVRCADCGSTLIFQRPRYFICNGYAHAKCASRQSIRTDELHEAVLDRLRSDADSTDVRYKVVQQEETEQELRTLRRQIGLLDQKLSRVRDAYASGVDTLEDYRRFKEEIDVQRESLAARIRELQGRVDPAAAESALREGIRKALKILEAPDVSLHDKNTAVKELFERCTWDKKRQTLAITYRVFV